MGFLFFSSYSVLWASESKGSKLWMITINIPVCVLLCQIFQWLCISILQIAYFMKVLLYTLAFFLVLTMNINYLCTVVFNFRPVTIKDAFIFINLQFTMYNSNYADSKFFCNVFTFFPWFTKTSSWSATYLFLS